MCVCVCVLSSVLCVSLLCYANIKATLQYMLGCAIMGLKAQGAAMLPEHLLCKKP